MSIWWHRCHPFTGIVAALAGGLVPFSAVRSQEITPFKLVNTEGYVQVGTQNDQYRTSQSGGGFTGESHSSQGNTRSEVFLMTHSYVYHPNFISLDVGGGPILQSGHSETEVSATQASATLYNFSARAVLFNQKPVHGTVFHEHLNPTVNIAPGQVMNQQSVRQGVDVSVLESVFPVPLQVSYSRTRAEGRSTERSVDDKTEQLGVTATRSLGAAGVTRLQLQSLKQDSQSGANNLPIQATSLQTHAVNSDTTLHLGDERQYTFTNLLSHNAQTYGASPGSVPDRSDVRWMADLRARHSGTWSSYALTNYSATHQGEIQSTYRNVAGGVTYWHGSQTSMSAGMQVERTLSTQFSTDNRALDANVKTQLNVGSGTASMTYSARLEERSQFAQSATTPVYGEKKTLSGFAWYPLSQMNVVGGSVIVSDSTRSQTYQAGQDYILVGVGQETRIQRTASGNILDGQDVLVDYQYETGGSYASSQATQSASLAYTPVRYTTFNLRWLNQSPQLKSGTPLYTLNHINSTTAGVRSDYPFSASTNGMLGWSLESERRTETLLSSRSMLVDAYVQSDDPWGVGNIRLNARQNKTEYSGSSSNIDLKGWGARYWLRAWNTDLSSDVAWERDTGGSEIRTRLSASLKAQWRVRKFSLNFTAGVYREQSGFMLRNNKSMTLNLRREL